MAENVLSTKVSEEEVKTIKSIAEEKSTTVSGLLRELLNNEIKKKTVNWNAPCFGLYPRDDEPKKKKAAVDEVLYGK